MRARGSHYDPDQGVLRLRHATLSVLARLAVAPTDPSLHDHDVAPLVAELRSLGILTPKGIDPAVAPLAEAVGGASRNFFVEVDDHGQLRQFRGWISADLGVVAAQVPGTDEHELMADVPAMLPSLLAEVVGLGSAAERPVAGEHVADSGSLAEVLASGAAATAEDVGTVIDAADDVWIQALTDAIRGAALRWELTVGDRRLGVLDAGRSGLWTLEHALEPASAHRTRVTPTTATAVRARVAEMLDPPRQGRRPG